MYIIWLPHLCFYGILEMSGFLSLFPSFLYLFLLPVLSYSDILALFFLLYYIIIIL